eukprot:gene13488-biopygen10771
MPRATNISGQRRRERRRAYVSTVRRDQRAVGTRPTEQPVAVPLDEMLQLQLQQQQVQQQAIQTLQAQQGAQFWPVPYPAGGEGLQMAMAPLLQQPVQQVHPFQFPPEWQQQLQQIHLLQFQPQLQQMQPVQFIPQFQHQPPQMQPVQLRPQLPQLQQMAVQPAAEEQPPAPAVPQPQPQPEQPANHPAENINLHHIAPMNNTCPHCGAKYFKEELNTTHKYTKCCHDGAVTLPQIQPPPTTMMSLFLGDTEDTQRESKDFLSKFRQYNATMAMASWTANIPQLPGKGPPVITTHGSAYHRTAHLRPLEGQQPKYAELYIMDTAEALEHRTNNPTNRDLNKHIIKKLQDELLAGNPYAQEYNNIGKILQQQQQQATAANEPLPTFDMIITSRANQDHRYHSPAAAEIAAIYSTKDGAAPDPNDRILHIQRRDGYLIEIKATNPTADPLTYPLLFPFGEHGWGTTIARLPSTRTVNRPDQAQRHQTRVTPSQFYTHRIQVRDDFSALHLSRLLFQQYLVDAFTKIEDNDLTYIRSHQKDLRVESYKGLMDHLYRRAEQQNLLAQAHNPGTAQHVDVGRVIILPSSFTGSQRSTQQNYQDAMTIVRKHGKPDIFLTFTANPSWQDILENLLPNQKPQDRPDISHESFT